MSKLYFENELGASLDLQSVETCFYEDIDALGVEYNANYINVGDVFVRNYLDPKQTEFNFKLNFFQPKVYEKVQSVGNFLMSATSLILVYKPDLESGIEYRREVELTSFVKNTGTTGYLSYSIKLSALSLFYYKRQTKFYIKALDGEMRYDFRWDVRFNDYADRAVTVPSGSHVDIAFDLEIDGYTENPKVEIIVGEKVVNSIVFPVTLLEGEKLIYSSQDKDLKVKKVDKSGNITNIYTLFDLEDNIFFKIPKTGAVVKFTADTKVFNTIIFTVYNYFKVV